VAYQGGGSGVSVATGVAGVAVVGDRSAGVWVASGVAVASTVEAGEGVATPAAGALFELEAR
jgi:hypothetical protein